MDLDEMLRVDRCRDMGELINLSARSGLQSGCRNQILSRYRMRCNAEFYYVGKIPLRYNDAWFYNGFIHREPSEQLCRRYMRSIKCSSSYKCNNSKVTPPHSP